MLKIHLLKEDKKMYCHRFFNVNLFGSFGKLTEMVSVAYK